MTRVVPDTKPQIGEVYNWYLKVKEGSLGEERKEKGGGVGGRWKK